MKHRRGKKETNPSASFVLTVLGHPISASRSGAGSVATSTFGAQAEEDAGQVEEEVQAGADYGTVAAERSRNHPSENGPASLSKGPGF